MRRFPDVFLRNDDLDEQLVGLEDGLARSDEELGERHLPRPSVLAT